MDFLRQLFGPSKDEVWRQLCGEIGAEFVDGGFWKGSKVQARHGEWTITLDTVTKTSGKQSMLSGDHSMMSDNRSTTYTRIRAPFVNRDGFRFTIYRKGFFTEFGKWFGMQDVEIGHPEFDEAFVIQGNDEQKLRQLFANPQIRGLIHVQPAFYLTVRDDEGWFAVSFPEGVDELFFSVAGVIKDVDQLKGLYMVFAEVLNELCRMGSAYENDPQVTL